jgi:hypothetical protein
MATTKPYRFEARAAEPLLSAAVDVAGLLPDNSVTFRVELERDLEGGRKSGWASAGRLAEAPSRTWTR